MSELTEYDLAHITQPVRFISSVPRLRNYVSDTHEISVYEHVRCGPLDQLSSIVSCLKRSDGLEDLACCCNSVWSAVAECPGEPWLLYCKSSDSHHPWVGVGDSLYPFQLINYRQKKFLSVEMVRLMVCDEV